MEVHHHPDLHHKPKHFKEYFLEFVMIFLAVTLGFFAESLREHIGERSKEKQYISAFIRNLQDDTAVLKQAIAQDSIQVLGIDSLLMLKHTAMNVDSNRKRFYLLTIGYLYNSATFKSNDATLQQLKSTGDYRLIEKDHIADSLSNYDAANNFIYDQGNYYSDYFKEILSMLDDISDMTVYTDTLYVKKHKFTGKPLPALSGDSVTMRKLFNKFFDFNIITGSYVNYHMRPQLANATRLIAYLRKEYDLDE